MHDEVISTIDTLRAQLAAAEARAELAEAQLRHTEQEAQALREQRHAVQRRLDGFLANMPGLVWENYFVQDPARGRETYVSANVEELLGYTVAEWMTPNFWFTVVHPEDREQAARETQQIFDNGRGISAYRWIGKDGRVIWVAVRCSVIRDDDGATLGMRGITLDVTDMKEAEAERNQSRLREEVLQAQQESLLALSMPLVPIGDDLLAMTLVGKLDELRADRVITTLLDGVSRRRARVVILDITGVPEVDRRTADTLVRAARAVSLLGAEVVLTGVGPLVAGTLVEIGVDLGALMVQSTLKAGMEYALRKVQRAPAADRVARRA
jgi:PAS domain S-box-containing protein